MVARCIFDGRSTKTETILKVSYFIDYIWNAPSS